MQRKISILYLIIALISLPIKAVYPQAVGLNLEYFNLIQQKVNSSFIYPQEAKNKGWEGIAKVKFTVVQDGRIKKIEIAESSGYPLLDAAAILAIKDASPYPFPSNYKQKELEVILPVNYRQAEYTTVAPPKKTAADIKYNILPLIQQKVNSSFIYPQEAKNKGWEGIAKVKFTVVQDGRIKKIEIAESSGYPLLDAAAILAIKDASPYPFPKDCGQKEVEVILPVNYKQTEYVTIASYKDKKDSPAPAPALKKPARAKPAYSLSEETPVKTSSGELGSFIDTALKNNQPTQVALEEIKFAHLKVTEARRNLFPALKLSAYTTKGEVYKVDYEERENRIQLDQPLFYGRRLGYTFKQAETNLEITQKNYDRLKLDVLQKTETAYYNLISAKMNYALHQTILKEGKDMLAKIEKLSGAGMVIPLELTSARSYFKQTEFQLDNIKQDLFMAELTLKQVMNVKEPPLIKTELLEAPALDLDLDNCLETAFKYRPEIYLSQLLVKFNDYGQKVEWAKNNAFTVDFTSSYGYYEGAYRTEPMRDANNWSLGIKASKPWGANTVNTSYTTEKSQPRIGQTSPTASSTVSTEFNLLDNVRRVADKKRSDIDLRRSLSDFNETLKTINFEVQDAFLNYQKAVLQLNTAKNEVEFKRNELDVTKMRAMVGDSSLSNAMSILVNLSEAQTKYTQALANYRVSLANLKKATGYGIRV